MKSFLSDKTKLRGFSIMELLVATVIFLIITGFVIANFRAGQRHDELELAGRALASNLRQAQSMALAGVQTQAGKTPSGFGIFININKNNKDNQTYQLFADFCEGEGNACDMLDTANDPILETFNLGKNIKITAGEGACVIFHLPNAAVVFSLSCQGQASEGQEMSFTIKHLVTEQEKIISVNFLGQISEN